MAPEFLRYIPEYRSRDEGIFLPGCRLAQMHEISQITTMLSDISSDQGGVLPRRKEEIEELVWCGHFIVHESEGMVDGTIAVDVYTPRMIEIRSLSTLESGKGIGSALLASATAYCDALGFPSVFAVTDKVSLFHRFGFDISHPIRWARWLNPDIHEQVRHIRGDILPATHQDIDEIMSVMKSDVDSNRILPWTKEGIAEQISNFLLLKRNRKIQACGAWIWYTSRLSEIRALCAREDDASPQGIEDRTSILFALNERAMREQVHHVLALIPESQQELYASCGYGQDLLGGKFALWRSKGGAMIS